MFFLSLEERISLARFVKEKAGNRIPVIASGHISDSLDDQAYELNAMADTGVDAVVMITNRLALKDEPDYIWIDNLQQILNRIPKDVCLGFYECPYPYKRVISPDSLKWCADTGRFFFLKDTSCSIENMTQKMEAIKGSGLKIYNANTATLLESLKLGISGYSGVMANFHPDLYVWLMRNWRDKYEDAKSLINFLSVASQIERQLYPVNAKYYLSLEGIKINISSRSKNHEDFTSSNCLEIEQLLELSKDYSAKYEL
jgi:4-hydroxy-tetrahydrodipicolinate synthase